MGALGKGVLGTATKQQAERRARALGAHIEKDEDAYQIIAPDGKRWEPGLHMLCVPFEQWGFKSMVDMNEAWAVALERMSSGLEDCDAECEHDEENDV